MDEKPDRFVEYYKEASLQQETVDRFDRIRSLLADYLGEDKYGEKGLRVADIGCGTGVQALMWAQDGHEVFGLDINQGLIDEAESRSEGKGLPVLFCIGSADELPWPSASMDVCLVPELLEHVPNWRECLDEFCRILRPGGVLYLSTTNRLCPKQQEFDLPLYSWYPGRLKQYCERLAVTTKPHWVEYAKFPAINWFDFYVLKRELEARGLVSLDRVDVYARGEPAGIKTVISKLISSLPPLRFLLQIVTPYSQVIGVVQERDVDLQ